jgi:phenylpropionate dioxygenase-like ring-hydroxylating dioxygenase large terminal subunit
MSAHAWHPIAAARDLPPRHVFHAKLLGQELAVWRADDGYVNVWENRCLHRGVRLSIGLNEGQELKCQYHGWRYASRTAGCTYIPAHPEGAPARRIANRIFPVIERHGLIWSALETPPDDLQTSLPPDPLVLREIAIDAPAAIVEPLLAAYDPPGHGPRPIFFIQPTDSESCVIRGVITEPPPTGALALLRLHDAALCALRDVAEQRPTA